MNLKALPKLFAQVSIETRSGDHFFNILFNRNVVSDFAVINRQTTRGKTTQIEFANYIIASVNQLAADTLAAIVMEDNRVNSIQPFAVCVMSRQSAVVG